MNKYDYIFWVGLIIWFLETWYFGWNESAQSIQEKMFDTGVMILMVYGVIGSWASSINKEIHIHINEQERINITGTQAKE